MPAFRRRTSNVLDSNDHCSRPYAPGNRSRSSSTTSGRSWTAISSAKGGARELLLMRRDAPWSARQAVCGRADPGPAVSTGRGEMARHPIFAWRRYPAVTLTVWDPLTTSVLGLRDAALGSVQHLKPSKQQYATMERAGFSMEFPQSPKCSLAPPGHVRSNGRERVARLLQAMLHWREIRSRRKGLPHRQATRSMPLPQPATDAHCKVASARIFGRISVNSVMF